MSNKEYKRKFKPWLTTGILNSISRKNKIYNKYTKIKNDFHKNQVFEEYKLLRNTINELIRKSKKSYYQSFFAEYNTNIIKLWEGIKELDPELIRNSFNNYFVNIADDILTRKFDGKKSYTEYLNNPVPNSFVFDLYDASEVDAIIIQLSITKASGPNGIPTKILQMISKEISPPLSKICNMAIATGTHPEKLKPVNGLPIY